MAKTLEELYKLLKIVMDRLETDQPPCQRKDDIKQKNQILKKIKEYGKTGK